VCVGHSGTDDSHAEPIGSAPESGTTGSTPESTPSVIPASAPSPNFASHLESASGSPGVTTVPTTDSCSPFGTSLRNRGQPRMS
jgi:hypothetical protein